MKFSSMASRKTLVAGFTLVELLVVIVLLGILTTLAVPSFTQYQASQAVRNAASDLVFAMSFARSEAVKRNTDVTVSATSTWDGGWVVKAGTLMLREFASHAGVEIESDVTAITYKGTGRATAGATFDITPLAEGVTAQCVRVSGSGKPNNRTGACG
ncbi:GspH/FimT family pseudopilin [Azotobacter salinestris]|uniref:GspH/FimT family pseudopilin n=1 Tax=Azotobacter salinestris TaxID=69964 RepID=UPI0032DEED42